MYYSWAHCWSLKLYFMFKFIIRYIPNHIWNFFFILVEFEYIDVYKGY